MIQTVTRDMFKNNNDIQVGQQFNAQSPAGQVMTITITDIDGDNITVDGNHPLAGMHLNFAVEVIDIREATNEEITHGHVHGPGGHHHD